MKTGWIIGGAALLTGLFGWLSSRATAASVPPPLLPQPPPAPLPRPPPSPTSTLDPWILWADVAMGPEYLNLSCDEWKALSDDDVSLLLKDKLIDHRGTARNSSWIINARGEMTTKTRAVAGPANVIAMASRIDDWCAAGYGA